MPDVVPGQMPPVFVREEGEKHFHVHPWHKSKWLEEGPPDLFTPHRACRVLDLVASGNFPMAAAKAVGITSWVFNDWMARAEKGEGDPHVRAWFAMIEEVSALTECAVVGAMLKTGPANWQWWLERRSRSNWGKQETTVLANPDGTALGTRPEGGNSEQRARAALALVEKVTKHESDLSAAAGDSAGAPCPDVSDGQSPVRGSG